MTREEARIRAARLWLTLGRSGFRWLSPMGTPEEIAMIKHERELIRRRLQRLAKPRQRNKP